MKLLIDIGNSRLKWATATDAQFTPGQPVDHAQIHSNQLITLWAALPKPEQIALACVSNKQLLSAVSTVAKQLWPKASINAVHSQAKGYGVSNAYEQPEALGVDRWLALVAAYRLHPGPACIIDCGTAITIDLLDSDGHHLGGMISPGLTLMKEALASGTEQLPLSTKHFGISLAKETRAAIASGTLAGAVGLIAYTHQHYPDFQLLLTGGDAPLIAEQLRIPTIIDTDLVLRGLAIVTQG